MLVEACEKGIENVADAPPELAALIDAMERLPDWVDWEMIEEGARASRNLIGNLMPYLQQVGFVLTFMNVYTALPMTLTGTLSHGTARRRVLETAFFFAITVMPRALTRSGRGFKSAAMVRLMHSMVRFNLLRGPRWDTAKYGIPIPQVDALRAAFYPEYALAQRAVRSGRTAFTRKEQARWKWPGIAPF